jgi:hypothetical protein
VLFLRVVDRHALRLAHHAGGQLPDARRKVALDIIVAGARW